MSIELIAELYNRRSVDSKLQRVLLCLCDAANDSGVCWPSVGRIAWKLECSEATVQRAIRDLKNMGVVTVSTRDGRSNVYRVDLSLLPHKPPYRDETGTPLQNDTPLQSVPPTPLQNDTPGGVQNEGGTPLQNDTLNRKGNHKGNRKEEPSIHSGSESPSVDEMFETFWESYPRPKPERHNKKASLAKFKIALKKTSFEEIVEALEWWKRTDKWKQDGGQYIDGAQKWLHQEMWEAAEEQPAPQEGGSYQQLDQFGIPAHLYGTERITYAQDKWREENPEDAQRWIEANPEEAKNRGWT